MSAQNRYHLTQRYADANDDNWSQIGGVWAGDTWKEAIQNWLPPAWRQLEITSITTDGTRSGTMILKSPTTLDGESPRDREIEWLIKATLIED